MAKHRPNAPMSIEDSTTEHVPGDPAYSTLCQELLDRSTYAGTAPPEFPDKVVVHHMPEEDEVQHVWKRDGEK